MTKVQTAEVLDIKISTNQVEKDLKNSYDGKKKLPLRKKTLDDIKPDYERDKYLTDFGKATLVDRYLLPGEKFQDMFVRVTKQYSDDYEHGLRIYDYISKLWFMPATPVLSNGGAKRGLPISCFLNSVSDSLDGILSKWGENVWLASNGGGIGTYWGDVRSIGETVKGTGQTSGIIPFVRVMDSLTLAISQGSLRRGSAACYLDVHHPEIEEFLEIRKPSGDFNRKSLNLHHGINITDDFMNCVKNNKEFSLKSPKNNEVLKKVNARELWQKILETRMQTGEPYLVFIDTVNKTMSKHQKEHGLKVTTSNLCSEIMLHTGKDHKGNERTAVCCLSSVNLERWNEWNDDPKFIEDIMRFLDNVLDDFIKRAPKAMSNAVYSAMRERSVGLGAMGFHSFLQKNNIPFESPLAKSWNMKFFKHIRKEADKASLLLALERGACPDAREKGIKARFSHKMAIAPTASISIICGGTSACIEPIPANIYTHKTLSGSFTVKNKYLEKLLDEKNINNEDVWQSIIENEGSVLHLKELNDQEKNCFKTAFEIDQRWVVEFASDRTPFICQSQSINLFLSSDIDKWDLMMLHWKAWESGVKSLYYCRSKSIQRASYAGVEADNTKDWPQKSLKSENKADYDECLSCQ
ncbi:MAG: ribonucleoside-diphosphate reductase subunit alpha [Rickettsiales bacterium TMED254]|nr:ribonucleotide-diphosphate reductase subunit alpha [Rickettsiales bacterium]RPF75707.1 MAG: ribonucleoside-diphosphate reductase subunit alpha [Rickettsiales bacterium TMED254]